MAGRGAHVPTRRRHHQHIVFAELGASGSTWRHRRDSDVSELLPGPRSGEHTPTSGYRRRRCAKSTTDAARRPPTGGVSTLATAPNRRVTSESSSGDIATELAARRTGMSFQRTRMSADRTLMSVIRTSLSLIGFGFTIYQVFQKLLEAQVLRSNVAPRRFGEALVFLGIGMLVLGIGYHIAFMIELRNRREEMRRDGLVHAESGFPASLTLIVAILLLGIGILAGTSMLFGIGPFE